MLQLPSTEVTLKALIANRKYGKAATVASFAVEHSSPEKLGKIVAILAAALTEIGDRHAKRGRPKKESSSEQNWRLFARICLARGDYALAVIARDLVDDRTVPLHDLAWFFFKFHLKPEGVADGILLEDQLAQAAEIMSLDVAGSRDEALPYAEEILKKFRLGPKQVPRKGFKTIAAGRIAERRKLRIDQVRPKRRE